MASWSDLERELDAWSASGRQATVWWRDDDATAPTPALTELTGLATAHAISLGLAVIPAGISNQLPATLADHATLRILQHGFAHTNHEPPTVKKAEFGTARAADVALADVARGRALLSDAFAGLERLVLPVFVPPWNRIAPQVVDGLTATGHIGLSTFRARTQPTTRAGAHIVNTHVDVIDWRGSRSFVGTGPALAATIAHLAARRAGTVDPDEPTGFLTHHLEHNTAIWAFLDDLFGFIGRHPAVEWPELEQVFGLSDRTASGTAQRSE